MQVLLLLWLYLWKAWGGGDICQVSLDQQAVYTFTCAWTMASSCLTEACRTHFQCTLCRNTEGGPARLPANQAHHGVHGHHAQPVATGVGTAGAPVVQQY